MKIDSVVNMKEKKIYKKVYVEITNRCNLSCSFCIKNKRIPQDITIANFKHILTKLEPFTNHLYLHILGEPLLHQNIQELITLASKKFYVNIPAGLESKTSLESALINLPNSGL